MWWGTRAGQPPNARYPNARYPNAESQDAVRTSNRSAALIAPLRQIILNMLSQQLRGSGVTRIALADEFTTLWEHEHGHQQWQELLDGRRPYFGDCPQRPVMFPGSFNPPHQGHRQMVQHASTRLGSRVHLEISLTNVDKPELDYLTIKHRTSQAQSLGPVVLTRAAKFVDKSHLFPGATFLIGADTAMRLDDVRFYNNSIAERETALGTIAAKDCRFLVFGRLVGQSFLDASGLSLSPSLRSLCDFVPAIEFRVDISSREIRQRRARGQRIVDPVQLCDNAAANCSYVRWLSGLEPRLSRAI